MSRRLVLQIKRTDNSQFSVEVDSDCTVAELKDKLAARSDISVSHQRLIYKGQVLKDEMALLSYGVSDGSQIHLIRQSGAVAQAAPGTGGSLGGGLGNVQQHLIKNPDVMEAMLNSPQMQAMLGNPEMLRAVISMNPEIKTLTDQHPELAHMLNDSQFLSQAVDSFRSPAAMREMMRSTDRAISNIDAVPGGFNALAKMYKDIQSPLYDALAPASASPAVAPSTASVSATDASREAAGAGLQGKPVPNPWAPNNPKFSNFEPSAAAAMLQDPNMQALIAALFRSSASSSAPAVPAVSAAPVASAAGGFGDAATVGRLFDPSFMQLVAELERSVTGGQTQPQTQTASNIAHAGTFGGAFGTFMSAMADNPEIKWRAQLAALRSMGFSDTGACVRALQQSNGNVNRAIDQLIAEGAGVDASTLNTNNTK